MHDSVPTQALDDPASPVADHLVTFLQALVQPPSDEQNAQESARRRGRPAHVAIEHL